jgi:hypothetical protein
MTKSSRVTFQIHDDACVFVQLLMSSCPVPMPVPDFEKPFDAPAILVVGHQTDGKSALVEALMVRTGHHHLAACRTAARCIPGISVATDRGTWVAHPDPHTMPQKQ